MSNTASQAQIQFINSLKEQRDLSNEQTAKTLELGRRLWAVGEFDKTAASAVIDALKAAPRAKSLPDPSKPGVTHTMRRNDATVPEGMHRLDGVVYKVQRAVHGSGRPYAKALAQDEHGGFSFEYAAGVVKRLSEDTLMTLDQAKQFGALYGTCCACGRVLTNEESIEAGIGPICAGRF